MSVILLESFDGIGVASDLELKGWTGSIGTLNTTSPTPRTGANCWKPNGNQPGVIAIPPAQQNAHIIAGAGYNWSGGTGTGTIFSFCSNNNANENIRFIMLNDGIVQASVGGTVVASSSQDIPQNTWVYVDAEVVLNATTGLVRLVVDGQEILSSININTIPSGYGNVVDTIRAGSAQTFFADFFSYYDDVYLASAFDGAISPIGPISIRVKRPISNGASSQFTNDAGNSTNNFSHVDSLTPQMTSFVEDGTVGDVDTYACSAIPDPDGSLVLAAQVVAYARSSSTGRALLKPIARSGGTNYAGTDQGLASTPIFVKQMWATDPANGAWTVSSINAAEFGIQVG